MRTRLLIGLVLVSIASVWLFRRAGTPAASAHATATAPASLSRSGTGSLPWWELGAERLSASNTVPTAPFLDWLQRWSESDPAAAAAWCERRLSPPGLERALDEVVAVWADKDPAAALNWLITANPDCGTEPYTVAMVHWAASDVAAAALWVENHPDDATPEALKAVLRELAVKDQAAAAEWFDANVDQETKIEVLPAFLTALSDDALVAQALREFDPVTADECLAAASRALALADPARARALAMMISDPEPQQTALQALAARSDAAPAVGLAIPAGPPVEAELALPQPPQP